MMGHMSQGIIAGISALHPKVAQFSTMCPWQRVQAKSCKSENKKKFEAVMGGEIWNIFCSPVSACCHLDGQIQEEMAGRSP
jgi:hypothetical protein